MWGWNSTWGYKRSQDVSSVMHNRCLRYTQQVLVWVSQTVELSDSLVLLFCFEPFRFWKGLILPPCFTWKFGRISVTEFNKSSNSWSTLMSWEKKGITRARVKVWLFIRLLYRRLMLKNVTIWEKKITGHAGRGKKKMPRCFILLTSRTFAHNHNNNFLICV